MTDAGFQIEYEEKRQRLDHKNALCRLVHVVCLVLLLSLYDEVKNWPPAAARADNKARRRNARCNNNDDNRAPCMRHITFYKLKEPCLMSRYDRTWSAQRWQKVIIIMMMWCTFCCNDMGLPICMQNATANCNQIFCLLLLFIFFYLCCCCPLARWNELMLKQ